MKAVIFDMDGTMVDNMMVHHRAWQNKLSEYGLDLTLDEVQQQIHGVNIDILERLFGDRFTEEERIRISEEKETEYRSIYTPELIPGLGEFLHELKYHNIPIGIGSAAPGVNVEFILNELNLWKYVRSIKHSGDVSKGKPDPEVYLKLCDDLGLDPRETVIFEDSPTGAESAHRAGAQVYIVTTTHDPDEFSHLDPTPVFISDFSEMSLSRLKQ